MQTDLFGSPISARDPAATAAWDALQMAVLSHSAAAPQALGDTLAADPDFALAHAVKGLALLLLARRELEADAHAAFAAAKSAAAETPRERAYIDALGAWLGGRPSAAAAHLEAVLRAQPGDALAMKLAHGIRFILGQPEHMAASLTDIAPAYGPDHPGYGYYLGCRAFAQEELGDYGGARRHGTQALEHATDDAWGLHAVAHVHDMTADSAGGLAWLEAHDGAWSHCNNFRFHVWWHKALLHLDLGQTAEALALYDAKIRAEHTDDYRDIANATSLLMRLELEGVALGDRWAELADLAESRTDDGCLLFADLHYLLALVGGGRQDAAERLVARIVQDGARVEGDMGARFADPGQAAAAGLAAFGEARYALAFQNLRTARIGLQAAGGSHAQRDVFDRLTIDAGIRAGRLGEACEVLHDRTLRRGGREDGFATRRRDLISALARKAGVAQ